MPHRSSSRHKRKRRQIILLALGILLFIAGMYGIAQLGPTSVSDPASADIAVQSPQLVAMRADVAALEEEFNQLVAKAEGAPDEDVLAVLQQAIDAQQKVVETSKGFFSDQRELARLKQRMGELVAAPLLEESTREEDSARHARLAGDQDAAAKSALRALEMQRQINQAYPFSSQASAPRLARLERLYREISAEPMAAQVAAHEQKALQLIEEDQFEEAAAEAAKALSIQTEMVALYPDSPLSRPSRLRDLEQISANAKSSRISAQIQQILQEAETVAAQDSQQAVQLLDQAIALQNEINRYYSGVRAANPDAIDALEQRRQDLVGRERANSIIQRVDELDQALRDRRHVSVQSLVAALNRDINNFNRQFPKSTLLVGQTLERLQYLQQLEPQIPAIQDALYEQLRPIPGASGFSMLDREVSQLLYEQVVGLNPSTSRADFLPVDAVTYPDASNFIRKVGWILARPVRLPTQEEFRAALGDVSDDSVRGSSWNSVTTDDRNPQLVATAAQNSHGFYDLLGNVAEWLEPEPGADSAPVIGGSARDNPVRLAQVPVEIRNLTDRQRHTGFRIVVQLSPSE